MWILRATRWLLSKAIWLVGVLIVTVPPEDLEKSLAAVETNIAGYLKLFGLDEWAAGVPEQADSWLLIVLAIFGVGYVGYVGYLVWKWRFRRDEDTEVLKTNPGNGWRVARVMMKAARMRQVRAHFMDFEAVEASRKSHELEVLAAYGLRCERTGTVEGGSQLACMEEQALLRGLGGEAPFLEAYRRLDNEFPAPWWTRLRRKWSRRIPPTGKKYTVAADKASWSFDVPDSAADGVTLTRAPTFWRDPIGWTRRNVIARRHVDK